MRRSVEDNATRELLCYVLQTRFERKAQEVIQDFSQSIDSVIDDLSRETIMEAHRDVFGPFTYLSRPAPWTLSPPPLDRSNINHPLQPVKHLYISHPKEENTLRKIMETHLDDASRSPTACAKRIQSFWKRYHKGTKTNNDVEDEAEEGFVRSNGKNVICPVTQDKIPFDDAFALESSTGHQTVYTATGLARYIVNTSNFSCPCSRIPITEASVARLEGKLVDIDDWHYFPGHLLRMYYNRDAQIRQRAENSNYIIAYENACGLIMSEMCDLAANLTMDSRHVYQKIIHDLIPEWHHHVHLFFRVDYDACYSMLRSDKEKLRRLTSNVVYDPHEALKLIIAAIGEVDSLSRDDIDRNRRPAHLYDFVAHLRGDGARRI